MSAQPSPCAPDAHKREGKLTDELGQAVPVVRDVVLCCWTGVGVLEVLLGRVPKQLPALRHRPDLGLLKAALELGRLADGRRDSLLALHTQRWGSLDTSTDKVLN
jgi:hypothetical protein